MSVEAAREALRKYRAALTRADRTMQEVGENFEKVDRRSRRNESARLEAETELRAKYGALRQ